MGVEKGGVCCACACGTKRRNARGGGWEAGERGRGKRAADLSRARGAPCLSLSFASLPRPLPRPIHPPCSLGIAACATPGLGPRDWGHSEAGRQQQGERRGNGAERPLVFSVARSRAAAHKKHGLAPAATPPLPDAVTWRRASCTLHAAECGARGGRKKGHRPRKGLPRARLASLPSSHLATRAARSAGRTAAARTATARTGARVVREARITSGEKGGGAEQQRVVRRE